VEKQILLNLEQLLDEYGISRYELTKRIGSHYPIVDSYYKNKVKRWDSDLLLRICIALDCEISDLIKITDA